MGILKFYLGRILGAYMEQGLEATTKSGPLLLYGHFRVLVGDVLVQPENLGPPGPFIPSFYQISLFNAAKEVLCCINNLASYPGSQLNAGDVSA